MKIILVNPYSDVHIITPPLGLGYLSSYVQKRCRNVDVSIIDCLAENLDNTHLVRIVAERKPDLVGLTVYSMFYETVKDIIRKIKADNSSANVVIGGPHVSALPEFSLEDTGADFAIFGEGEDTLAELVDNLNEDRVGEADFSAINGLCFRDSANKVTKNSWRNPIENISDIPWPDWQLMDPNRYPPAPHGGLYKRFPIAPITTTRGCPFKCAFCGTRVTWKGVIRYRTKDDVADEIEHLVKKYSVREFHFEDDNFTFSRKHAIAICEEIIKRKLNIVWACPNGVRIDTLDDELLKIMKISGCYLLAFGIESGSQEILDKVNKHLDKEIVYDTLKRTKKSGIETWGFFIIGLPGENKKTVRETIDFAKRLPLDRAQFCNFMPIPGTPLFDLWLEQSDKISLSDVKWDKLNFYGRCTYNIADLDAKEIAAFQKKAFLSFYGRPRIALNILSKIKMNQTKFMMKRCKEYILK